jgi:competence protein ComEC
MSWRRFFLVMGMILFAFAFVKISYQFPSISKKSSMGLGEISISELKTRQTSFGKQWIYYGTLKNFITEEVADTLTVKNIPIRIAIPNHADIDRPHANKKYRIQGQIKEPVPKQFTFSIHKDEPWHIISNSWGLAEIRFQAKENIQNYIKKQFKSSRNASFLRGLATGDFDDQILSYEFSRFGLQHIMAISGFHFGIIAGILSMILRFIISEKKGNGILIILLTAYFIFLGCSPSIMRAWIMALLTLWATLIEKRNSGLNALGMALIIILLFDPLMCQSIGFQFSFVATAGILLFYPLFQSFTKKLFKKRNLSEMIAMDTLSQHAYLVLALFRNALALGLAVNFAALPITLYYFHKFPLMGFIYNLFFPFLVSITMLLLLIGILFHFTIPSLGEIIHVVNNTYTSFILDLTYNLPISLDYVWRVTPFPSFIITIYLFLLFSIGIYLKEEFEKKVTSFKEIQFI